MTTQILSFQEIQEIYPRPGPEDVMLLDGSNAMLADMLMGSKQITSLKSQPYVDKDTLHQDSACTVGLLKEYITQSVFQQQQIDTALTGSRLNDIGLDPNADYDMGQKTLFNLREPTADQDCATKKYTDELFVRAEHEAMIKGYSLSEFASAAADVDVNSQQVKNLPHPISGHHASRKTYVDDQDTALQTQIDSNYATLQTSVSLLEQNVWKKDVFDDKVRLSSLDQMAVPTSAVDMVGQQLVNLPEPVADTNALTKKYGRENLESLLGSFNDTPKTQPSFVAKAGLQFDISQFVIIKKDADKFNQLALNVFQPVNDINIANFHVAGRAGDATNITSVDPKSWDGAVGEEPSDVEWVVFRIYRHSATAGKCIIQKPQHKYTNVTQAYLGCQYDEFVKNPTLNTDYTFVGWMLIQGDCIATNNSSKCKLLAKKLWHSC